MFYNTYKLLAVNIFIFATIAVAGFYGYLTSFFINDVTHISYILAFIMFINVVLCIWDSYQTEKEAWNSSSPAISKYLHYIVGQLFYIGILGTVLGFSKVIMSIQDLSDVQKVLHLMAQGSLTLFNTTAIGLISYLWTRMNNFIVEGE